MSQINENYIAHKNELGITDEWIESIQHCCRLINRRIKFNDLRDTYTRAFTQVLMNGRVQIKYLGTGADVELLIHFFRKNFPSASVRRNKISRPDRGGRSYSIPSLVVDVTSYVILC